MVSGPMNIIGRLSVGVKLTLTFLIVVFFTTMVLSLIQVTLTRRNLEEVARMQLEEDLKILKRAVGFTRQDFAEPAWSFEIAYLEFKDTILRRRTFYGVWPDGRLILPVPIPAEQLPSRWVLMEAARRGQGVMRAKVNGKPCWLAYGRNGPGEPLIVLQMWEKDLAAPGVESRGGRKEAPSPRSRLLSEGINTASAPTKRR